MAQLVTPPNPQVEWTQPINSRSGAQGLSTWALRFLTNIVTALNGSINPAGYAQNALGNGVTISTGQGDPTGKLGGNIGDLYLSVAGGATTTLYVKTSGVPGSNTGWTAK